MKLLRLLVFSPLLFFSLSALSQITDTIYVYPTGRYPNLFTEETNPDSSNFEVYSQKGYAPRRANLWNLKRYFDQALTFSGDTLYLSAADTTYSIFLGDYSQTLTLSNDTLTLSDGNFVVLDGFMDNFTASSGVQRVADNFSLNMVGLSNLSDDLASNDSLIVWDASSDSHVRIDVVKLATAVEDIMTSGSSNTIYSASDTLSGNITVTGDGNDLNFDGIDSLSVDGRVVNINSTEDVSVTSVDLTATGDNVLITANDSIRIETPDHLSAPSGALLQKLDQLTSRVEYTPYYFPDTIPGSGTKILQWEDGEPSFVTTASLVGSEVDAAMDTLYFAGDSGVSDPIVGGDTLSVNGSGKAVVSVSGSTMTIAVKTDTIAQNNTDYSVSSTFKDGLVVALGVGSGSSSDSQLLLPSTSASHAGKTIVLIVIDTDATYDVTISAGTDELFVNGTTATTYDCADGDVLRLTCFRDAQTGNYLWAITKDQSSLLPTGTPGAGVQYIEYNDGTPSFATPFQLDEFFNADSSIMYRATSSSGVSASFSTGSATISTTSAYIDAIYVKGTSADLDGSNNYVVNVLTTSTKFNSGTATIFPPLVMVVNEQAGGAPSVGTPYTYNQSTSPGHQITGATTGDIQIRITGLNVYSNWGILIRP